MIHWILSKFMSHQHVIVKTVVSDKLYHEKGEKGNVAFFSGRVLVCSCGHEIFEGSKTPWFEGSKAVFNQIYGQFFDAREGRIDEGCLS